MVEPVTTGALVAAALASGAASFAKGALSAAGADAYAKLKGLLARFAGGEVAGLEANPDSRARAGVVAEIVDARPEGERSELRTVAEALRAALGEAGRGALVDQRMSNQFYAYDQSRQFAAPGGTQIFGAPPGPEPKT